MPKKPICRRFRPFRLDEDDALTPTLYFSEDGEVLFTLNPKPEQPYGSALELGPAGLAEMNKQLNTFSWVRLHELPSWHEPHTQAYATDEQFYPPDIRHWGRADISEEKWKEMLQKANQVDIAAERQAEEAQRLDAETTRSLNHDTAVASAAGAAGAEAFARLHGQLPENLSIELFSSTKDDQISTERDRSDLDLEAPELDWLVMDDRGLSVAWAKGNSYGHTLTGLPQAAADLVVAYLRRQAWGPGMPPFASGLVNTGMLGVTIKRVVIDRQEWADLNHRLHVEHEARAAREQQQAEVRERLGESKLMQRLAQKTYSAFFWKAMIAILVLLILFIIGTLAYTSNLAPVAQVVEDWVKQLNKL